MIFRIKRKITTDTPNAIYQDISKACVDGISCENVVVLWRLVGTHSLPLISTHTLGRSRRRPRLAYHSLIFPYRMSSNTLFILISKHKHINTNSNTDTHTARPKRWKRRKYRFWTDMWCCTRRNRVCQRRCVRSSHPQIASCLRSQRRWWVNVKEEDRVRIICSRQRPRRHMRNFFSHRHRWKRTKPRRRRQSKWEKYADYSRLPFRGVVGRDSGERDVLFLCCNVELIKC